MTTQEAFTPTVEGDDALVEFMARAMAVEQVAGWDSLAEPAGCEPGTYDPLEKPWWRECARAALNALREHGKEVG